MTSSSNSGKRIQVRRSGVHGKGVFALTDIAKGEILIEYIGEVISWKKAQKRHPTILKTRTTRFTSMSAKNM